MLIDFQYYISVRYSIIWKRLISKITNISRSKKKEKASPPSLTSNFIPAKLFVRRFRTDRQTTSNSYPTTFSLHKYPLQGKLSESTRTGSIVGWQQAFRRNERLYFVDSNPPWNPANRRSLFTGTVARLPPSCPTGRRRLPLSFARISRV